MINNYLRNSRTVVSSGESSGMLLCPWTRSQHDHLHLLHFLDSLGQLGERILSTCDAPCDLPHEPLRHILPNPRQWSGMKCIIMKMNEGMYCERASRDPVHLKTVVETKTHQTQQRRNQRTHFSYCACHSRTSSFNLFSISSVISRLVAALMMSVKRRRWS
jgi:hypothetical protein